MAKHDIAYWPAFSGSCVRSVRSGGTVVSVLVICIVLFFGVANAEQKLYASIESGLTHLEETQGGTKFEYNEGYHAGGSLGLKRGHLRVEGEVVYRENKVNQATIAGTTFGASGDVSALSFMGNVYYDFENKSSWTPYVGSGIGAAQLSFSDVLSTTALRVNDEDLVLAYKFEAGFALEMDENIGLFANYHYFATTDPKFTNSVSLTKFQTGYKSHNLGIGLSFRF